MKHTIVLGYCVYGPRGTSLAGLCELKAKSSLGTGRVNGPEATARCSPQRTINTGIVEIPNA